jgi:hypothetical protein
LRAEALRLLAERHLLGSGGPAPTAHGRPVEIQVAASLETVLGRSDAPGEIPGVGPASARCPPTPSAPWSRTPGGA